MVTLLLSVLSYNKVMPSGIDNIVFPAWVPWKSVYNCETYDAPYYISHLNHLFVLPI